MSAEYDAALEICGALKGLDVELTDIAKNTPNQRERIATAAMQGLLAQTYSVIDNDGKICQDPNYNIHKIPSDLKMLISHTLKIADALIAELNKPTGK